jgi:hypothetical protein
MHASLGKFVKTINYASQGKNNGEKRFIIKNDEFPHSRKYRKPVATCETVDGMLGQSSLFSQEEGCSFRARFL